jgi:hypothetical protein
MSESQRRKLIVEFCLENPKCETVEHFKLLGFKIPTIYRTIIGLRSKKKWREKLVPGKNYRFYRLKFVLP